jgi:hypothetical protein
MSNQKMISDIRSYTLPDSGLDHDFVFFNGLDQFRHTARDHFVSENEPWHRILHFSPKVCQKTNPLDGINLEELYSAAVSVLDEGIRFSVEYPIYVRIIGSRRRTGSPVQSMDSLNFLSDKGFVVIVRDGIVRTAYFVNESAKPNPSASFLFERGWYDIRVRALKDRYGDSKSGEEVEHRRRIFYTPENWVSCPSISRASHPPRTLPSAYQRLFMEPGETSSSSAGGDHV